MSIIPDVMDPMDSILMLVLVLSIASGMLHPEELEFTFKGFIKFWYTWLYRSAQAFCQNASKLNPSLGALTQRSELLTSDAKGNTSRETTETTSLAINKDKTT